MAHIICHILYMIYKVYLRDSTVDEQILFKKQGTGTLQRKSSLLHSDDVFILIESCQSFPNINLMNPIFERKKRTKSTNQKAKKSGNPSISLIV